MATIEHRHLRSALEFAVLIAAEGQKRRPPLPFPKELKPFLSQQRLAGTALGRVRRAIEGDPAFRGAISAGALPELVDEVGRLWLAGGEGWEAAAAEHIAQREAEAASTDLRRDLKRAEKRRTAAEQAAARIQVELLHRDATIAEQATELDDLRAEVVKARDEIDEIRAELIDTRNEIRHARDREAAAVARAEAVAAFPGEAPSATATTSADPTRWAPPIDEQAAEARRRLAEAVDASREFVDHLERLLADDESAPSAAERGRAPPDLDLAARWRDLDVGRGRRHLVAADAPILVDGYNVAKLAWPDSGPRTPARRR